MNIIDCKLELTFNADQKLLHLQKNKGTFYPVLYYVHILDSGEDEISQVLQLTKNEKVWNFHRSNT